MFRCFVSPPLVSFAWLPISSSDVVIIAWADGVVVICMGYSNEKKTGKESVRQITTKGMIGYISNVVYSIVCLSSFEMFAFAFAMKNDHLKQPSVTPFWAVNQDRYLISFYLAAIVYASRFYFNFHKVAQSSKVH